MADDQGSDGEQLEPSTSSSSQAGERRLLRVGCALLPKKV